MQGWLVAYLLTCAVELPIVVWALRTVGWWPGLPRALALAWVLQLTHPLLWLVNPPNMATTMLAEVIIVLVEGSVLALWASTTRRAATPSNWRTGLLIALAANAASLAVGLLGQLLNRW